MKVDLDKVKIEAPEQQPTDQPQKNDSDMMKGFDKPGTPSGGDSSAPAAAPDAKADDPMKAVLDAMKKDEPKK